MENKEQIKVITLFNESERIQCKTCNDSIYHTLTMQAIKKDEQWKLRLVAICIRCRTKEEANFSQD
jgi:RNase P subunit RPR2